MKNYSNGDPRVHNSHSVEEISSAITEYEDFAEKHINSLDDYGKYSLAYDLRRCALNLREELELRKSEGRL